MKLIVAADDADGISARGIIPWTIAEDMKRFKTLTMGGVCLMGRKTWESLPPKFRPLPGRTNVILSRQNTPAPEGAIQLAAMIDVYGSQFPAPIDNLWVIGGAAVYEHALRLNVVDEIYLTRVHGDWQCDLKWCGVPGGWSRVESVPGEAADGTAYRFERWLP